MKKYLVKIIHDTNDADYVYGLRIVTEEEKAVIDQNLSKSVEFGPTNLDGVRRKLSSSIEFVELRIDEAVILEKLGLSKFGEGNDWQWDELEDLNEFQSEDEDEE